MQLKDPIKDLQKHNYLLEKQVIHQQKQFETSQWQFRSQYSEQQALTSRLALRNHEIEKVSQGITISC